MIIRTRGIAHCILFLFLFSSIQAQEITESKELSAPLHESSYTYSPNPKIDSLITFAFKHLHKPYRGGGSGPNSFDCSGFTSFVYGHFGYKLERSSGDQTKNGVKIADDEIQPGDLVFWKGRNAGASRIGHVGMVVSVNPDKTFTFIHSACQTGVSHDNSTAPYYAKRYVTACRVIDNAFTSPITQTKPTKEPESIAIEKPSSDLDESMPEKETIVIRVEKGETLYALSKKYNCTIFDIKEWNNLNSNSIHIGQELEIKTNKQPGHCEKQDPVENEVEAEAEIVQSKSHKVEKGETLFSIAKKYDCTVNDLRVWNNLDTDNIHPNQELTIGTKHAKPESKNAKFHKVKSGETLSNIAERYNCTIKQLKQKNGLNSSRINVGQRLKIPQD